MTLANYFSRIYGADHVTVAKGVDIDSTDVSGIQAALDAISTADLVILAIGEGNAEEHEGIDRSSISLPGLQEKFAQQVLAMKKRTVVVLINGGVIGIENIIDDTTAVVEGFNGGMRLSEALFLSIFGLENRWGRLPVTSYKSDIINQLDMYSFNMTGGVGRTYRYFQGEPLFPFGYGLSYSTFAIECAVRGSHFNGAEATITCLVRNTGARCGDNVLMVYQSQKNVLKNVNHPVPNKTLVEFSRVHVKAGSQEVVEFQLTKESFSLTNEHGDRVVYPGRHNFEVNDGTNSIQITVQVADNLVQQQ